MAIFGSLTELPFPEVVTMLGRRCGRLELSGVLGNRHYALHIADGNLRGLTAGGLLVDDVLLARDHLKEIMGARSGEFEFAKLSPEDLEGSLNLPLQRILLSITVTLDEMAAFREHFADARTCFRATRPLGTLLDEEMDRFWQKSYQYFSGLPSGVSAQQLAQLLQANLEQVQYFLYKLRAAGLVTPVRIAQPQTVPAPRPTVPAMPNSAHAPTIIAPPQPTSKPRTAASSTPPSSLVVRMLRALKGRFQ